MNENEETERKRSIVSCLSFPLPRVQCNRAETYQPCQMEALNTSRKKNEHTTTRSTSWEGNLGRLWTSPLSVWTQINRWVKRWKTTGVWAQQSMKHANRSWASTASSATWNRSSPAWPTTGRRCCGSTRKSSRWPPSSWSSVWTFLTLPKWVGFPLARTWVG